MRTATAVRLVTGALVFCSLSVAGARGLCAEEFPSRRWSLPDARDVQLRGELGAAYDRCVSRLGRDPYHSLVYLRSDLRLRDETAVHELQRRHFRTVHRDRQPGLAAGEMIPDTLPGLLRNIARVPKGRRTFLGRDVDWNMPLEPETPMP